MNTSENTYSKGVEGIISFLDQDVMRCGGEVTINDGSVARSQKQKETVMKGQGEEDSGDKQMYASPKVTKTPQHDEKEQIPSTPPKVKKTPETQ